MGRGDRYRTSPGRLGRLVERDLPPADRNGSLSPRRERGANPKALLEADADTDRIVLDTRTTLTGMPPEAWRYRLGNRGALVWVLDQHKERMIELLAYDTRVSIETRAIVEAMRRAPRCGR